MQMSSDIHRARLAEFCAVLRDHLEHDGLATSAEIRAAWPGGKDNRGDDIMAWARCLAALRCFLVDRSTELSYADTEALRWADAMYAALSDRPLDVHTADPASPEDRVIQVYPKTAEGFQRICECLQHVEYLRETRKWLESSRDSTYRFPDQTTRQIAENISAGVAQALQMAAWTATVTEPGVPSGDDIPQSIKDLDTETLWRIAHAATEVNLGRVEACKLGAEKPEGIVFVNFAKYGGHFDSFFDRIAQIRGLPADSIRNRSTFASQVALSILVDEIGSGVPDEALVS